MHLKLDELPPRISELLYRVGLLKCNSIMEVQECDLLNLGILSDADIKLIYNAAGKGWDTELISGKELGVRAERRWGKVSSGCVLLDNLLGGGLLTRGITELAGQSGCGKTQLCLQLVIAVQLPLNAGGLDAGAVFICTEDKFPSVRLNQLLKTSPAAKKFPDINFGNNIFVEHIADVAELKQCVEVKLPQLMKQCRIGVVVVDSVAAVFRADYTQTETLQRARDLRTFSSQLHLLANTYNIAVVCINQVTDVKRGDHGMTVPALGLAWANLITCRLQMFRDNKTRRLQVIFAPHLPQSYCQYKITAEGVEGVGPTVYV